MKSNTNIIAKIIKMATGKLPRTTEQYLQIKLTEAKDQKNKYKALADRAYNQMEELKKEKTMSLQEINQLVDVILGILDIFDKYTKKYHEAILEIDKYSNALVALRENSNEIKVRFGRVYYNDSII